MLVSRMPDGEPEVFASIQGEGITAGIPCVFVRLAECNLACTWCFVPETPILLADWTWRPLGDVRPGDVVVGIEQPGAHGAHVKLATGTVTRVSRRCAPTVMVNDTVRCTPEHRFWLTGRDSHGRAGAAHSGWREVSRAKGLRVLFTTDPVEHDGSAYERGWLAGIADGDGCFWTLAFRRGYRRFRLALNDGALLERAEAFAANAGYELRRGVHVTTGFSEERRRVACLWLTTDARARQFEEWLSTDVPDRSWYAGYLGGMLDAEGSHSRGVLRIAQDPMHARTRARIECALRGLELRYTAEPDGYYVHRRSGASMRALTLSHPRKQSLLREAFGHHPHASRAIERVEPTGAVEEVVTITTTLGSYVAAGYVVKNCDTKYTWDWDHHERVDHVLDIEPSVVVERVVRLAGVSRRVVITGGEPLLQQPSVEAVVREVKTRGFDVEIETSGTIEPTAALGESIDQWNVSPKLDTSGNRHTARLRSGPLTWFAACSRASFKFVVTRLEDVDEVVEIARRFDIAENRITLMPEATSAAVLTAKMTGLVDACQRHGFRLGTRLHVLMWGSERGR